MLYESGCLVKNNEIFIAIIIMSLVVLATRALPFICFRKRKPPPYLVFAEKYIPAMVVLLLVLYSLMGTSFIAYPYGLPEVICIAIVAALHYWKENTLFSIGAGTGIYMLIVQSL